MSKKLATNIRPRENGRKRLFNGPVVKTQNPQKSPLHFRDCGNKCSLRWTLNVIANLIFLSEAQGMEVTAHGHFWSKVAYLRIKHTGGTLVIMKKFGIFFGKIIEIP